MNYKQDWLPRINQLKAQKQLGWDIATAVLVLCLFAISAL